MILYLGLIFSYLMLSIGYLPHINQKTLLKISLFILWILATFRSIEIGNDTKSYYELFKKICMTGNYHNMTWRFEIGYLWINKVISYLTNNFTVFLGLINTFIYIIYYYFIKQYSNNYMMSVFLFFTLGMWGNTLNIIRLELAITLALLGFMIIKNRNKKRLLGIILSLLPITFQRISIVYIFGLLIPNKINKKYLIITFFGTLIIVLFLPSIVNFVGSIVPYFANYYLQKGSTYSIDGIKLASILNITIALSVFLFGFIIYEKYSGKNNQSSDIAQQINMIWISFLILLVSLRFNLIDRCSYFFWTFSIVMIPNICGYIKGKNNRIIVMFLIFLLCILYFVVKIKKFLT